jgi:hypothetical protein
VFTLATTTILRTSKLYSKDDFEDCAACRALYPTVVDAL